jgi:heptosyltransferase-2
MAERRTALVRLSNWIGDVMLTLPALQRLADAGWTLQLVGKGWAKPLLAGTGWAVHVYPKRFGDRVALLRGLARDARQGGGEVRALCFPNSLGSALEFRLAGVPAVGYRKEGRRPLLAASLPLPAHPRHEVARHWALVDRFLGDAAPLPPRIVMPVSAGARAQADTLLQSHGVPPRYVVVVPFATGHFSGHSKKWPHFAALVQWLQARGVVMVACPGPGEDAELAADFPSVIALPDVRLDVYLAVLSRAALVIANDTGPGHMAAAVGAPLLSLLGPSDPAVHAPWGPNVRPLHDPQWVSLAQVQQAVVQALPEVAIP